ncbi:glycosyltransferase [Acaryochloris sp. IP29b_bin.137]|uniref:glycosyltransferase n=1 Tax=Acaryochloris sp. IP29b_bin.137 TaxID=2969217 RepID=UPI002636D9BE|nr:glycosyltransferase [Acaryochloris sp. IP29b_bin.137]
MITVVLGTSPFPFNRAISWVGTLLEQGILKKDIFIQYGASDISQLAKCSQLSTAAFIAASDMKANIEQSQLVISHAGQGLTRFLADSKVPFVLLPRLARFGEHIDDHQLWFAEAVAQQGIHYCMSLEELEQAVRQPPDILQSPLFEGPKLVDHLLKTYPTTSRKVPFLGQ